MKTPVKQLFGLFLFLFLFAPASEAVAQTRVWISNPTNFNITYRLLFTRSSQNFTIPPGLRNEHSTREYPPTFLVDVNVNLRGYPQIKRFRLDPNSTYYFQISGTQLNLLKQPGYSHHHHHHNRPNRPHHRPHRPAPVTAKVLVYSLGGPQPVFHSSIILYNTTNSGLNGKEWHFVPFGKATYGNIGYMAKGRATSVKPRGLGAPVQTIDFTTRQSPDIVAAIFSDVFSRWDSRTYRALDANCNHFVNDMIVSLGAGRLPIQYLNSWGPGVNQQQIASILDRFYGCTVWNFNPGVPGQGPGHGPGHHHQPQPIDGSDILRELLKRIGI